MSRRLALACLLAVGGCYYQFDGAYRNGVPFDAITNHRADGGEIAARAIAGAGDLRDGWYGLEMGVVTSVSLADGTTRFGLAPGAMVYYPPHFDRPWAPALRVSLPVELGVGGPGLAGILAPTAELGVMWLRHSGRGRSLFWFALEVSDHIDLTHSEQTPLLGIRIGWGWSGALGPKSEK